MLLLVVIFVGIIVLLAFYLNSVLDKRTEKRLKRELEDSGEQP